MKVFVLCLIILMSNALCVVDANADIAIPGGRIVYPLSEKEIIVPLQNIGVSPVLAQIWIEDGNHDLKPSNKKAPFLVTPSIFRMEVQASKMLRVFKLNTALPNDRESMFWLNVNSVLPGVETQNSVRLASRKRFQMFARPAGLPGQPENASKLLKWKVVPVANHAKQALRVSNPTPYFVSFSEFSVNSGGKNYSSDSGVMVKPFGSITLPVFDMKVDEGTAEIYFKSVNDFGVETVQEAVLDQ